MIRIAIRNVYRVSDLEGKFIEIIPIDFTWYPGFSISQKRKSIKALHTAYLKKYVNDTILEISSKSEIDLGKDLSAFNLNINAKDGKNFSVECAFQSSKVFENGGPYIDILKMSSREAKKDSRLKTSGKLIGFKFYDTKWELEPKTLFYNWLYIRALYKNDKLKNSILEYNAFTDIEFNQAKSINCQAEAAALYVSLSRKGLLNEAMKSIINYKKIILNMNEKNMQLKLDI